MPRILYDKQAVISDIAEKKLSTEEISKKYGISVDSVWQIKSAAVKAGLINSRGFKSIEERVKDEESVLTPVLREKIKDMRDRDLTTSEITNLLRQKGIMVVREDIEKVMARGSNEYADARRRLGRVIRG